MRSILLFNLALHFMILGVGIDVLDIDLILSNVSQMNRES